jgi:hypothetical protein
LSSAKYSRFTVVVLEWSYVQKNSMWRQVPLATQLNTLVLYFLQVRLQIRYILTFRLAEPARKFLNYNFGIATSIPNQIDQVLSLRSGILEDIVFCLCSKQIRRSLNAHKGLRAINASHFLYLLFTFSSHVATFACYFSFP